ncbi:MAG: O-antigen ligase family protein [Marinomonas sp.]
MIVFCAFAVLVALAGGSSRYDAVQLIALRPLAMMIVGIGFFWFSWRRVPSPVQPFVIIFGLWVAWVALQLVPIPADIWRLLPGREPIAKLDTLLGFSDAWRPLSISPAHGWNALAGLVVPSAAFMVVFTTNVKSRVLMLAVLATGLASALLGILQLASVGNDALYFYSITSNGRPVGLFANENHAAIYSSIALVTGAFLLTTSKRGKDSNWLRIAYIPVLLLLLISILSNGSRIGLSVGLIAILVAGIMFWLKNSDSDARKKRAGGFPRFFDRPGLIFGSSIAAVLLLLAFILSGNVPGLREMTQDSLIENYRWQLIAPLKEMASTYWLFGSGFGSFAEIYKQFEPAEIMLPQYVNHAHNDWFQVVIEGGVPAIALVTCAILLLIRALRKTVSSQGFFSPTAIFITATVLFLGVTSAFDYPIRAPIFQVSMIWLLVALIGEER